MLRAAENKRGPLGVEMPDQDKILFMIAMGLDHRVHILAFSFGKYAAIEIILETQLLYF